MFVQQRWGFRQYGSRGCGSDTWILNTNAIFALLGLRGSMVLESPVLGQSMVNPLIVSF